MDAFYEEDERIISHAADNTTASISARHPVASWSVTAINGIQLRLEPRQIVIPHGFDRDLDIGEALRPKIG